MSKQNLIRRHAASKIRDFSDRLLAFKDLNFGPAREAMRQLRARFVGAEWSRLDRLELSRILFLATEQSCIWNFGVPWRRLSLLLGYTSRDRLPQMIARPRRRRIEDGVRGLFRDHV